MNLSGVTWITSFLLVFGSLTYNMTLLSSSAELTPNHVCNLINKYKPSYAFMSPNLASVLLKHSKQAHCDFSCIKNLNIGGNVIPARLLSSLKNVLTNGTVCDVYGLSEVGIILARKHKTSSSAVGQANNLFEYRFVDPATGNEVGPNEAGELWLKGPTIIKGYYNDPVSTKEAFSEDGWFKTGDLVTYNEDSEIFYVDRLKMLIKYKNYQISPVELEDVIRSHPSVEEVAVVGVSEAEIGELPAACVVVKPKCEPNAKDIIDLVKNKLADFKQLRGGVLFVSRLPVLSNGKLDRKQVKELVLSDTLKLIKK